MAGSSLVAGILPNRSHEPFAVLFELAFPHTVDGKELVVKPEQALVVTQVLEAIYQSAKSGEPVKF